jgi:hypothetical protein
MSQACQCPYITRPLVPSPTRASAPLGAVLSGCEPRPRLLADTNLRRGAGRLWSWATARQGSPFRPGLVWMYYFVGPLSYTDRDRQPAGQSIYLMLNVGTAGRVCSTVDSYVRGECREGGMILSEDRLRVGNLAVVLFF